MMRAIVPVRLRALPILLVLFLIGGLSACGKQEQDSKAQGAAPPAPEVGVITVQPRDVAVENEYAGRTAGFREVEVRARVTGILQKRTYVEGQRVKAGDVLFQIDPAPFVVALERAQARLQDAEARLRQAERDWVRVAALYEENAISARERDASQSNLDLARANLAAAKTDVEAARIDLGYTRVEAPVSGVTSLEVRSEGSLVGPGAADSLLTRITQLDPLYVNFSYPDADALRQRALLASGKLTMAGEERLAAELRFGDGSVYGHEGYISFTDSTIDPATGTVRARAVFPNPEASLLPGQFVRIVPKGLTRKGVIVIPQAAVMQGPQGTFVYVVGEDDKAKVQPVTTGSTLKSEWLIEEGLKPGDRVIVDGVIKVRPGSPVKAAVPEASNEPVAPVLPKSDRPQPERSAGARGVTA
ncbi:MAG: efflux RND transporter periplasmic adaptor subunit [Pseudomonadota bacterium]|nr:efflux RND transporter periplasmic adaptor subunit [Candidatus Acidoferrales bacterium]